VSLRRALYYVTPFILIFIVMAEETMEAVFQWGGAIPLENLLIEGHLLRLYAPAIFFLTFYEVVNQAFYARHVTRIALLTSVMSLILNPLFCVLFTRVLDFGIYGLPMAYVLNSLINMVVMAILYRSHLKQARPYRMLPFYLRLLLCSVTTVIVLLGLNTIPMNATSKLLQLGFYAVKALLGMLVFYFTGLAINFRESRDLERVLRRMLGFSPARS
jgi:peptidoglycan biosynthesis protein MviN/MurJ (putative lipid II flippase)